MARDLLFCHACHNEFYNSERCPRCGSDFIEKFEEGNDPSAFYDDEGADIPASDLSSFLSSAQSHAPPPNARTPQQQQQSSSPTSPHRGPATPNTNPFGLPPQAGQPGAARQPTNPMFLDGYRNILEQLLGGLGQVQNAQHPQAYPRHPYPPQAQPYPAYHPPQYTPPQRQPQPQVPQPPSRPPASPSRPTLFQGEGYRSGTGSSPPPQPQQPPQPTRTFHYSITTYGPDGAVRQFTNSSQPGTPTPEGRQVVVPTLEDFLGMHMGTPFTPHAPRTPASEDPYFAVGGPLNMLAQMLESMSPLHGNPGDYLRPGMTMDDLITQLMDQGHTSAPPPASTDAIGSLPRIKADKALVEGGKECTVCKENLTLGEDVIRLPCLHVFHEDCIIPWLKINGSCPVCRHSLNSNSASPSDSASPPNNNPSPSRGGPTSGAGEFRATASSWISNLFGSRGNTGSGNGNSSSESRQRTREDSLPPRDEDLD